MIMEKLSILIPAYNEEKGIADTLKELRAVISKTGLGYEVIVVDDGSSDRTAEIVRKLNGIKLIQHPYNKGYGASLKTGIENAKGDWILIIDADGTYPAKDIPKLLKHVNQYDMVVGARTGKDVKIQLYRKPAKWFLTKLANFLSGRKIYDLNSGMRIFRKKDAIKFFNILPSSFSFTTTITLAYLSNDYTIKYVPIDYHERKGKSKIKPIRDGANFIVLIIRTIMFFKPLKIFFPIALILFLFGFIVLLYQTIFFQDISQAPIMLLLASFQIGFLGLLADMIARRG